MTQGTKEPFIFFGTPDIARIVLDDLYVAGYVPELIVCNKDKKQGRGMRVQEPPTKQWAKEHDIPVAQPDALDKKFVTSLKIHHATYAIVVAYGNILPKIVLGSFPKGMLNLHPSLLPTYRGPTPVETALLHGDTKSGVSIMLLDTDMDHGPILAQKEMHLGMKYRDRVLSDAAHIGAQIFIEILPQYIQDKLKAKEQDHTKASYTKKIKKQDAELFQTDTDEEKWRKYQAYHTQPGTFFFAKKSDKKIRIKITEAEYKNAIFIPKKVIPEGRKEMTYAQLQNYLAT